MEIENSNIELDLIKLPSLKGKKIGVLYSGGMDSSVVTGILLKKGYDITLITIDNGALKHVEIAKIAAKFLFDLSYNGKILDHIYLSSFDLFQEMVIRKLTEDIVKYGKDYSCAGCKLGMMAVAIAYSKSHGIDVIVDGFVKAQKFYPEQTTAYITFIDKLCKEYQIEHYSPIYNISTKQQVKQLAISLNIPPRSIDGICLFEERPLQVDEQEVHDYLQSKEYYIRNYINFYEKL